MGYPPVDYSGHVPQEEAPNKEVEVPPHSHVLGLADGTVSYYNAENDTHGPVPTAVDGVPVVSVTHAYGDE